MRFRALLICLAASFTLACSARNTGAGTNQIQAANLAAKETAEAAQIPAAPKSSLHGVALASTWDKDFISQRLAFADMDFGSKARILGIKAGGVERLEALKMEVSADGIRIKNLKYRECLMYIEDGSGIKQDKNRRECDSLIDEVEKNKRKSDEEIAKF